MDILDNPFYILGATTMDSRQRISQLSDEKSLVLSSSAVMNARNVLTNPQKRVYAEVRWFPGEGEAALGRIALFYSKIIKESGFMGLVLPVFSNHTDLLLMLYEYQSIPFVNVRKDVESLLQISLLFEKEDPVELCEKINRDRAKAGFPAISDPGRVEDELESLRGEIRQSIQSRFLKLLRDQQIEIATAVAEKFAAPNDVHNGNAVISDLLAEYKLRFAQEINDQKKKILDQVSKFDQAATGSQLEEAVNKLSKIVIIWDRLTQPIQLAAWGGGMEEEDSSEVAYVVRSLAIDLHNKHSQTAVALKLITLLKDKFSELSGFAERIREDEDTLKKIQMEKKEEEEALLRNRENHSYSVSIHSSLVKIPPLCTCCLEATNDTETVSTSVTKQNFGSKTTRTVSMNMPLCKACLKHRKRTKLYTVLLFGISLLTAVLYVMVLGNSTTNFNPPIHEPLIAAGAAFILFGFLLRLSPLERQHSSRQRSVWLGGIGMSGAEVTYTFTNWRYAKLFNTVNKGSAAINGNYSNLTENRYRNRARRRAYLNTITNPIGLFFSVIALTLVLVLVSGKELARYGRTSPFIGSVAALVMPKNKPGYSTIQPAESAKPIVTPTQTEKLITTAALKTLSSPKELKYEIRGTSVILHWEPVEGASKYIVNKSVTDKTRFTPYDSTLNTDYVDERVSIGSTYYYAVIASDSVGLNWSEISEPIMVIIPKLSLTASPQNTMSYSQTSTPASAKTFKPSTVTPLITAVPQPTSIFSNSDLEKYTTLAVGNTQDSGYSVLLLKDRLKELGYYKSGTQFNNDYSDGTAKIVKEFQKVNGLEIDGIASPLTQALMFSPYAKPKPTGTPKWTLPPNMPLTPTPVPSPTAKPSKTPTLKPTFIAVKTPTTAPTQMKTTVQTPAVPGGVKAVVSGQEIVITWNAAPSADKYRVYRAMKANGSYVFLGAPTGTRFVDSSVSMGSTYYYRVETVAGDIASARSAYVFAAVPKPTATSNRTPTAVPRPTMPPNGKITNHSNKILETSFKVTTPQGSDYYYIVLVESTNITQKVVSFIVYPGRTVEVMVPSGKYIMYYAAGDTWFGNKDLFGKDTAYNKSNEVLDFTIYEYSVSLVKREGGNLQTYSINESVFPK